MSQNENLYNVDFQLIKDFLINKCNLRDVAKSYARERLDSEKF